MKTGALRVCGTVLLACTLPAAGRAADYPSQASGGWQVLLSAAGYGRVSLAALLGGLNWVPVPADYDGDGLADPAVTNPATREWRVKLSGSGYAEVRVVL